ncbi:hypothetical protein [Syntrophobacter fumaroxidans]|uniref:Uncharacterized protein n=1 Tax=Syntrophobacter fumaroxidans (strain DSM 10017 / MPOB) TaxID=335543 RepID=A0LIU4_SYNFM|nr:hypothetical protein [Syntrophobacter fumaroxidans]ABK17346.1 hypothetical protein Sfum_1659 [Syntrophobacter fumaroxidans MPOB]
MPISIGRRQFLSTMSSLLALVGLPFTGPPGARAADVPLLQILRDRYPRVFAFRQAEVLANLRDYSSWDTALRPLAGVVGKLIPEERTDTVTERNIRYFRQFKKRYPHKVTLLHLNGRSRLPTFETEGWYAGWWLYQAGTLMVESLTRSATRISVSDIGRFELEADGFGNLWEDLIITARKPNGKPNFAIVEHIRLVRINTAASALIVRRGQYGSIARAWPAGSYVAAHATEGPYFPGGQKLWCYNLSTLSPRDSAGRHVIDAMIDGLQPRFASGGSLDFLDGMELDVFSLGGRRTAKIDADGDGVVDGGIRNGTDTYVLGQVELTARLRTMLGPNRFLLTDGGLGQRANTADVNGVELEGVPTTADFDIYKWSQALSILRFFQNHGRSPVLSYGMYKFTPPFDPPTRFSAFRLAMAAALFSDSAFTFYDEPVPGSTLGLKPGPDAGNFPDVFTIWDEARGGSLDTYGWLGRPLRPAIHLAEKQPDLYEGAGVSITDDFIAGVKGAAVIQRVSTSTGAHLCLQAKTADLEVELPPVSVPGPDLVLVFDAYAEPLGEFPVTLPRIVTVTVKMSNGSKLPILKVPVDRSWNHLVLSFRPLPSGSSTFCISAEGTERLRLRRIKAVAFPDLMYREFEGGAVFANPSDAPATFDLGALCPTGSFRRLSGSPDQDPATNDGNPLGSTLTLPALDALVTVRS